ncbi:C-terminal domain of CHU protein family protein [Reichenbachiella faecimaris]|uniref:C-terminal domain of CHU protein family protein n=1 Tax=Reichenbachiella faecimaris TaxID=692418 RepID=A0A1W2GPS8_REIFA|nr:gliding motility-associated C-terminal domain-containing protein [Reichenbachiella faecimaris]SMD38663.1 C-terminal domain of CHU protein family protein [Reichenbachiella faecimaris]
MSYHWILRILGSLCFTLIFSYESVFATHIRAGEIVAVRISDSNLTYKFTVIGYTDTGSTVIFGGGDIDFGDGTILNLTDNASASGTTPLEDEVAYNYFEITHTFSAPGKYIVRYNERNRNAGIQNMSNSVDTPFYIETSILIDPFIGLNDTPVFLVPPIDKGAVGAAFLHNPGAYDSDGDSLSYRITEPKQALDRVVNNYLSPDDPEFYDNYLTGNEDQNDIPTFEIDAISGNVLWDAPGAPGEYNIAFIVDEWRKIEGEWFLLGSLTRDMQVIIEDTDNERPEITPPPDVCVEAGNTVNEMITATDPDGHMVKLEAFGGPFEQDVNKATLTPDGIFQASPASATFNWQTSCELVRRRPYEVQLKATDNPELGPKLVDFKTWNITVVAPAPTGLSAAIEPGRTVALSWDSYSGCVGASLMQIWRRVDSYEFLAEDCNVGLPESAGYQLIDTVDVASTTYLDDNNGARLAPGANYCYRIVAIFPEPEGGESYASTEVCAEMGLTAPVIIETDVEKTNESTGQIFLRWQLPIDLDLDDYEYEIVRFEGLGGLTNPDTIATDIQRVSGVNFLTYTDTGLDTKTNAYHYVINMMLIGEDDPIDWSAPASSVWLETSSTTQGIVLNWEALTPWSNIVQAMPGDATDKYYHTIYRYEGDGFVSEDDLTQTDFDSLTSIDAALTGLYFEDLNDEDTNPLNPNLVYYYYVETRGSYGNDLIIDDPIINKSQFNSAQLDDGVAPDCTPVLNFDADFNCATYLANERCSFSNYFRDLNWTYDFGECDPDVKAYRIYFSEDGTEEGFGAIGEDYVAEVQGTSFTHTGLSSFKGCYRITAVDKAGNEGEWDEEQTVCADNCPNYVLPNAFSPDKDSQLRNETFTPYTDILNNQEVQNFDYAQCPRFVRRVEFKVFDRAGGILFDFNSASSGGEGQSVNSILINWDGRTNSGRELPAGVYYYGADVTFDVLDEEDSKKTIKGWVQIVK